MNFGGFQLISQIGTGPDGVSYRALGPDGVTPVEVRDLSAARADPLRWPEVDRRVRLVRQFEHPCARRLIDPGFAHAAPFLILEWVEGPTLSEFFGDSLPTSPDQALALTHEIVGVLAAAHRVGLVHGRLGPDRVTRAEGGRPCLDFTGVDVCGPAQKTGTDRESDISALGGLLVWLLTGASSLPESVAPETLLPDKPGALLRAMLAADPADRPSAREVEEALAGPLSRTVAFASKVGPEYEEITSLYLGPSDRSLPTLSGPTVPMLAVGAVGVGQTLGRYVLGDVLGVGGQGVVYRAEDSADGTTVAVKVLRPEWVKNFDAARRFRKEARMLATVNNPFVVNLLEHNEDGGVPYLVMEFVTGPTLSAYLTDHGRLDEPTALTVAADIARALEDAHARGIIHRDVKPSNVMILDAPGAAPAPSHPRVKLTDFGLARPLVDQESLALTATGAVLGTPQYMAPEQSAGRTVDARTDIYALGATLFHMLSGRPPFLADTREQLNAMHHTEKPLSGLKGLKVELSEGVCRALERALAKSPDDRYPDATAFRHDLERLARGEPTGIPLHPILPASDPKRALNFEFRWELESTPRQLWPHVTNTDRLDRALGFPPLRYSYRPDPDVGVRVFAEGMKAGMAEAWEERPYEWVEPRRMGVLREYTRGPFHWLVSTVELNPRPGGGTTLVHRLRLEPRGWKARAFSPLGVGVRFRAALGRIYERIDATLAGKLGPPTAVDPFEPVAELSGPARERLDRRLDALASAGVDPDTVEWLGDLLARGPVQELARLRPLALARRWGLEPDAVLNACLHAAREGLLVLLWDILCPSCRLSCEIGDTLKAIREHGHCDACQLDFALDFANSVELIFRAHPDIRAADTGHYCAGGPAHAPHVLAQVRVAPGERFELELTLPEGDYRLRGPQLPWLARFQVRPTAMTRRVDVDLVRGPLAGRAWVLAPGGQVLALLNPGGHELLARVERETARDDALTAARALTSAPFRALFPGEVLSPGQLVSVTSVTLLVTDLDRPGRVYEELGEARAFEVIHEHFRLLGESIVGAGGTLVKTVDDGVVASFPSPEDAVAVALDLPGLLSGHESTRGLRLRVGVHRGPAMVATLDGRLDYFGPAVRRARRLLRHARGGELVLTPEVADDPRVFDLARERGIAPSVFDAGLDGPLHRLEVVSP